MDRSALEFIAEASASGVVNEADHPVVALPAGSQLHDLERFMTAPYRQRHTFGTERIADFCAYVSDEIGLTRSAVFVSPDGQGAEAVIDYGSSERPDWGTHRARLEMKPTPAWAAIQSITARGLTQRDLTDWIEDWSSIIEPQHDGAALDIPKAIAAIRRVEIKATAAHDHEEADFRAKSSRMAEIEAKSKAGNLPESFLVTTQVYPCTKARSITLRLQMLTSSEKPAFKLRVMGLEALLKDIAEEVELEIVTRLKSAAATDHAAKVDIFVGNLVN